MTWTRRSFLTTGASAATGLFLAGRYAHAATPRGIANMRAAFADRRTPDTAQLRAFAERALEAAKRGGATYADVQFRTRYTETWLTTSVDWAAESYYKSSQPYHNPDLRVTTGMGVRALYNGYWGFAGHDGEGSADILATLGHNAAAQAKIASTGRSRETVLAPRPVVADGRWETPIEIDPFTVSDAEKIDIMVAMRDDIEYRRFMSMADQALCTFVREERTVATMDGAFISQVQHIIDPSYGVDVRHDLITDQPAARYDPLIGPTGAGWEYLLRYPYRDRLPQVTEEALRLRVYEPMDVGRYDVVFDAASIADMIKSTLATATEADRAMGYLANGAGTSFLSDPLEMLGSYQVASPLVTLTTNRSMRGGCATVAWDDEGVVPRETTLIQQGILTDFQTTREGASWFAPYYQKRNLPVLSSGSAGTSQVTQSLTQVPPNFVLAPGAHDVDFLDLVRTVKKGVAVVSGRARSDYQGLTGIGTGVLCYEIKDGVIGKLLSEGGWNFRAPEFWKGVTALGGPNSVKSFGFSYKRDPRDVPNYFTVSAVPMFVPNLAFVKSNGR